MKLNGLLNETGAKIAPVFNKELKTEEEIIEFCVKKLGISKSYLTFRDGVVDVDYLVDFHSLKMDKLPFKFGKVKNNFIVNDSKLKTLDNFPDEVEGNLNLKGNDITSLKGCPKIVGGTLFIGACDKITSLEGISEELGALNIRRCRGLKSLHNIHKYIKKFNYTANVVNQNVLGGTIMIGPEAECFLEEAVLGIFLIPGINRVKAGIGNISNSYATFGPWTIINHHLMNSSGEDSMYDCQEELYNDGFKEFAKL